VVDQVRVVEVDQVQVVVVGEVVPLAQLDLRLDEALVQPLLLLPLLLPLPLPLQQLQEEQEQEVTMECQRSSNDSTISPSSTAPCHPPPVTVA
jgi:hypothetical protein